MFARLTRRFARAIPVVAALCIAAQFAAPLHEAVTTHVICAVHGELIDVAPGAPAPSNSLVDEIAAAGPIQSAPAHEHCGFAQQRRAAASHESVIASLVSLVSTERAVPPLGPVVSPIAILRYAPKSSPPAA